MTASLQDSIDSFVNDANTAALPYYNAGEYDNAVEAYKAAGNSGAEGLGPAIDERTHGNSASVTHQAWVLNGQLAKINSGPFNGVASTQADADNARGIVQRMWTLYQGAYKMITTKPVTTRPGTFVPSAAGGAAPTTTSTPSLSMGALLGGALVGAAVIGVAVGTLPAAVGGAVAGTILGALLGKKGT